MVTTKTRYTFADLLAQQPGDETLYEVLGGELVVFSWPNGGHTDVVAEVMDFLLEAKRAGYGRARTAPCAVAFDYRDHSVDAEDVTHPDVFFVCAERLSILGERCVEAAPDLVVEGLSPSTLDDDRPGGRKFANYERYGVPYYWLVEPRVHTVHVYVWRDGRYGTPTILRPGDTLTCPLFPTVRRDVAALFAGRP